MIFMDQILKKAKADGLIKDIDLETMYVKHVEANFDMKAIRERS